MTQVRCSSVEIQKIVTKEATAFSECLRSQERETQGQARSGHISLTFYQIKKARWPFPSESIPWEVWNLRMEIISLASEIGMEKSEDLKCNMSSEATTQLMLFFYTERQLYREKVGELLAEKILYIAESMNRPSYVPKMPNQPELDLIFDTSFVDIQPYLFKVWNSFLLI